MENEKNNEYKKKSIITDMFLLDSEKPLSNIFLFDNELIDSLIKLKEYEETSRASYLYNEVVDFADLEEKKKIKNDREMKDSKNIESIAKSNNEILLNSKKMILLMNSIQTQLIVHSENEKEFNKNVLELTGEFKNLIENEKDGKKASEFLSNLPGNVASAIIISCVKSAIGLQ